MKKIFFVILIFIASNSFSQEYKSAFGMKSGYPGFVALNAKFYMGEIFALDNSFGVNFDVENRFFNFQPIFEYNKQIGINTGYNWYTGLGPNLKYYTTGGYLLEKTGVTHDGFQFQLDALMGIEVTPLSANLNAAIEAGPSFNLFPYFKPGFFVNIAVRYAIK
jgi:hypothetical protein